MIVTLSKTAISHMKKLRFPAAVAVLCLLEGAGTGPTHTAPASPILAILQSELQRNMQVLKEQPVPAYFAAYTLHDSRSTQILAAFGAIERSEENHQRFATVEVRVGDYFLDNTHPIRGDRKSVV